MSFLDRSGLSANPNLFFSTAAGPNAADIYGPPAEVLDIWSNGIPVSASQEASANNTMGAGSGTCPIWQRRDVHALALIFLGSFAIWLHNNKG